VGCFMDDDRKSALVLAQEAEGKSGYAESSAVIERAEKYLDFLRGTRDRQILAAAREFGQIVAGG